MPTVGSKDKEQLLLPHWWFAQSERKTEIARPMIVMHATVIDDRHIELSAPLGISPGSDVVVSITEPSEGDSDHESWSNASLTGLSAAYGESEPEYGPDLIREPNPEYDNDRRCQRGCASDF